MLKAGTDDNTQLLASKSCAQSEPAISILPARIARDSGIAANGLTQGMLAPADGKKQSLAPCVRAWLHGLHGLSTFSRGSMIPLIRWNTMLTMLTMNVFGFGNHAEAPRMARAGHNKSLAPAENATVVSF